MITPSSGNTFVVTDFNKTLTKAFVNGEKRKSVIALLRNKGFLDEEYSVITNEFYKHYTAIESDPSLSKAYISEKMNEWRGKHYDLLVTKKLHKDHINKILSDGFIELRDGVKEFFDTCTSLQVPIIILSSGGLGDYLISQTLHFFGIDTSNTFIISNMLIWDHDGFLSKVEKPFIDSMNKNISMIKEFPFDTILDNRKYCLLLGDDIHDHEMLAGSEIFVYKSIGFYNDHNQEGWHQFSHIFDEIVTHDGDFSFPLHYIQKLLLAFFVSINLRA